MSVFARFCKRLSGDFPPGIAGVLLSVLKVCIIAGVVAWSAFPAYAEEGNIIQSAYPVPRVTAGTASGSISAGPDDPVTLRVALESSVVAGIPADWWFAYETGGSFFFLTPSFGWSQSITPAYQGPLFDFPPVDLLRTRLAPGTYTYYFGVDLDPDGFLTADSLMYDGVTVNVSGETPPLPECSVDTHQHLASNEAFAPSASNLLTLMDEVGIRKSLLMPPPISADPVPGSAEYTYNDDSFHPNLLEIVRGNPARFGLVAGGGILNPWIHGAVIAKRQVSAGELDDFAVAARQIISDGAIGFGEMAVLHLSYRSSHPFIAIPADHPLYLRLAEVAADIGVPIDIHHELVIGSLSVAEDLECFMSVSQGGGNNPEMLSDTLAGFEKLLDHNYKAAVSRGNPENARIVWSHPGWDNTGFMTVDLLRSLLRTHPNLYLSLKMLDTAGRCQSIGNRPLDQNGIIWPSWWSLIMEFPERFILGADEFVGSDPAQTAGSPSTRGTWSLLSQLPDHIARMVACENPRRIYRLD